MTLPDDPRVAPEFALTYKTTGASFAHLFAEARTFQQIDEVWRAQGAPERHSDIDEVLAAALHRGREIRAEGADITPSTDDVWEEWGILQNDVELHAVFSEFDFTFLPRDFREGVVHHATARRWQLIAAGVVSGPSPF